MFLVPTPSSLASASGKPRRPSRLAAFAERRPVLAFCLVIVGSNLAGSAFNIFYNLELIVASYMKPAQEAAFNGPVIVLYNLVAYSYCFGSIAYLLAPVARGRRFLRAGQDVPPDLLVLCRRRLVNMPYYVVWLELAGWLPGAVLFPLGVFAFSGEWEHNALAIWVQFPVSFGVTALLTTTQTFFGLEAFLIQVFYPDFFRDMRPADVPGRRSLTFRRRQVLYWVTVSVVPLVAVLTVLVNYNFLPNAHHQRLLILGGVVGIVCTASTWFIDAMVRGALVNWVLAYAEATDRVAREDYEARIAEKRPDELGRLTDRFNDMAAALGRARHLRETFGQFVHPDVGEQIEQRYQGLGGDVEVVTVLFADIRGFTRRSAGEEPTRSVELLNRFLSLAVAAIEEQGGWVDKFLGDGLMALFGAPRPQSDHADQAVLAANELLRRLELLNRELKAEGVAPLVVGIGIHTGPALVGCIGATLPGPHGRTQVRRAITAIGETINLGQRLEQLTKTWGGPILISEQTRACLRRPVSLTDVGKKPVPGYDGELHLYRVNEKKGQGP